MEIADAIEASKKFGPWAHVATVSDAGVPYVTPVHPCWEDGVLWTMVGEGSRKAVNVASNPNVSCHWQVGPESEFDSLMLWGTASVHSDVETKRRMWNDVMDYDLNAFAPGGPDDSPGTGFLRIEPTRIVHLKQYGVAGREVWTA